MFLWWKSRFVEIVWSRFMSLTTLMMFRGETVYKRSVWNCRHQVHGLILERNVKKSPTLFKGWHPFHRDNVYYRSNIMFSWRLSLMKWKASHFLQTKLRRWKWGLIEKGKEFCNYESGTWQSSLLVKNSEWNQRRYWKDDVSWVFKNGLFLIIRRVRWPRAWQT